MGYPTKWSNSMFFFIYFKSKNLSKDGAYIGNGVIKKFNRETKIERLYAMEIQNNATWITMWVDFLC